MEPMAGIEPKKPASKAGKIEFQKLLKQLHIFVSARHQIFDRVSDRIIGKHAAIVMLVWNGGNFP
jgi:hypothetical protein